MSNDEDTRSGVHRVFDRLPLGDSKRAKVTRHIASGGGSALATVLLLNQLYGADIAAVKQNLIDTATVKESIASIKEDQKEFKADYKDDMAWLKENMVKQMVANGVRPTEPPKEEKPTTVVIHYNDSTGRGVIVKGDSVWIPMPDTLTAIRPR